jgi:uncharacterized membrane protein
MERTRDVVVDTPDDVDTRDSEVVRRSHTPTWSPAQIIGLIVGIGFIVLGVAALAKTGFDTSHVDRPHDVVWHFAHSPLLGAIEVAYGALLVIASVVPGAARTLMAFLGAVGVAFGLVVLIQSVPNTLNDWLAVTHRNGWLFLIAGGVVLLAAIFSPVFGGSVRREHTTREVAV